MLRKLDLLVPSFLKEIDKQLLLKQPGLWASRIHYVVYFGSLGLGLAALRASIQPINLQDLPHPESAFAVLTIPAILALFFWAWWLQMFHVEKKHGIRDAMASIRNQFLYASGILLFASAPFIYSHLLSQKIAETVSHEVFIQDINTLNIGERYFPGDAGYSLNWNHVDYQYWMGGSHTLTEQEIRQIYRKNPRREDKLKQISAYMLVFYKYGGELPLNSAEEVLEHYEYRMHKSFDYESKYKVQANLAIIEEAHENSLSFQHKDFQQASIFFIFSAWLMLLVFTQSNWKHFLLTAVVGVAGCIFAGIFTAVMIEFFHINEAAPTSMLFLAILIFLLIQSYRNYNTRRLNVWKVVSLSLATAMTPLVPLMMMLMVDSHFSQDTLFNMLYVGMFIGLITWNIAYHRRFVELQAMPKEN